MELEREVEQEFRPRLLEALQEKVDAVAEQTHSGIRRGPLCQRGMSAHDGRPVSWLARFGRLEAHPRRYRCAHCHYECRPLLDILGVEPGRISGSLARLLALLAVVAPYPLAARLAYLLLGVTVSAMGIWRVAQRLGQAAETYRDQLSSYHADSRSQGAPTQNAPAAVVLGVDGSMLGMQGRTHRRRRIGEQPLPALPAVEDGHWHEVKTGVLLFVRRCEILDFWHALEHAWGFARLRYGEGSAQADAWVHQIGEDLRAGKGNEVIQRLKRLRPQTSELRDSLQALIRYYTENAGRMRYDEYLRLG
jgi:hypothetical protein